MKKLVILFSILLLTFAIFPMVLADEETQVKQAYQCLKNKINSTGCSSTSMSFQERVFSLLAVEKCEQEVISDNSSNQCWPKPSCDLKSTSQAILALNEKINTTTAENWLLSKTSAPTGIDWFLEIESLEPTTCTISYSGSSYQVSIGADKKISSNAGSCLTLSTGAYANYFLLVLPSCYNQEFTISCDKSFITTLLFKKQGSDTNPLHVLEEVNSASAKGQTKETVDAKCFSQGGVCNYEGSLWATLILYGLDYDVSSYIPYLLTLKDDNENYLPESFLYFITGKLRTDLLLKQIDEYWKAGSTNSEYYDTALALMPFYYESPYEKQYSINWLLDSQDTSGCWDNGNIRNTAFLLYSIWPNYYEPPECDADNPCPSDEECIDEKCVPIIECDDNNPCPEDEECVNNQCVPKPDCVIDSDCPEIACEIAYCYSDTCFYNYVSCQDNDDCCPPGCTSSNDNDCEAPPECTENANCTSYNSNSSKYCLNDDVYKNVSVWSCESELCVENETIVLVENCTSLEECKYGGCYIVGDECDTDDDCASDEECTSSGVCVKKTLDCEPDYGYCMSKADCTKSGGNILYDYDCSGLFRCCDEEKTYGTCSSQGGEICDSDEACIGGTNSEASDLSYGQICCISGYCGTGGGGSGDECVYDSDCASDEECKNGECQTKGSDCESHDGTCRISCHSDEEETLFYSCDYGDLCCISSGNGGKKSYTWIWVLLILILLSALGIVFRDKLRTQWMKLKSKFGKKKPKDKRRPGTFPSFIQPEQPARRVLPRKIIPTPRKPLQRRPMQKKPEEKPSSELDDVLKKLRDLGK